MARRVVVAHIERRAAVPIVASGRHALVSRRTLTVLRARRPRSTHTAVRLTGPRMRPRLAATLAVALLLPSLSAAQRVQYPATRTVDHADDYHGTRVADPYRWLEDLDAPATAEWVAAQNAVTTGYLAGIAGRERIKERLTGMWNYPRVSLPWREGGKLFFTKNSGLQRQSPYFMATGEARGAAGRATLVLDPNAISEDGSTSLSRFTPDPTGTYVAYGLSKGGADWVTVKVRRLADGRDLDDTVDWIRYSSVSWTEDGRGFFYTRYPEPPKEAGKTLSNASRDPKVYYHRLGTPQSADAEVFSYPKEPTWGVGASVSEDGRWLFAYVNRGTDPENQLYVADLKDPKNPDVRATLRPIDTSLAASFQPIGVVGSTAYVVTNLDAPRSRVVALDLAALPAGGGQPAWRTVVPESAHTLETATLAGGRLVAAYMADVKSQVTVHALDGTPVGTLPLPGIGTLAGLSARADSPELFFGFTSYLVPTSVYRYDVRTGTAEPFFQPDVPFDASPYVTEQVFVTSKDGTRVPMFVTHKRGLARDGSHPTMLYAYGGFNVNQQPAFSPTVATWLEMGGIYAVPNLRGGGEYGEAWHQAGKLDRKQNVFDDFIAAAEYLVRERYTSPAKLAIRGGSNGGLLVGAVMTQRPDLYAVALPAVGVMDMLRYHRFSAGVFWVPEYGSADDPQQFQTLAKYSPLHNLEPGTCYPATLTTTADHDDRVVPSHSFKWASALQRAQGCDRPVLIRIEAQGSHGYRPLDKSIAEQTDIMAFTAKNLGMPITLPQKVTKQAMD